MSDNQVINNPLSDNDQNKSTAPSSSTVIQSEVNREFKERSVKENAEKLGISYVNLSKIPINPDLLYLLTPEEAEKAQIFPFFRIGKKLRLALLDTQNAEALEIIENLKQKGYLINLNLTSEESLNDAYKLYNSDQYRVKKEIQNIVHEDDIKAFEKEIKNLYDLKDKIVSMPSEEALNLIDVGAVKTNASDIHFQPEETYVSVRFRIDGVLQKIFDIDPKVFANISNQLKYKSKMKLNIDNVPQDGRYYFTVNQTKIDVRVSAIPTEFGEAFVCRLLDSTKKFSTFEDLGFGGHNKEKIDKTLGLSRGMVLVTGPTGSGKTTTLYSMLAKYNTPEKKIITLEDPVEYWIENVIQSQINQKRDYTFASGLRSILRQDPDVIMIGEIRDFETAEAAAQASLTGHVVLSTLHTNSAIETIPRLVNMGLPEFMIAPALNTVIAQRLVRRVCDNCHTESPITASELNEIDSLVKKISEVDPSIPVSVPKTLKRINGCDICSHTGYKSQIGIVEIVNFDDELKDMILEKQSVHKLFEVARKKKMLTMEEDGVIKVLSGITTLEEVHRVTRVM